MSKKTEANPQDPRQRMQELYMAHQAHTLAHMLYQQLATSWTMGQPWLSPGGDAYAPPAGAAAPLRTASPLGAAGFAPGAGSPLVYWYP